MLYNLVLLTLSQVSIATQQSNAFVMNRFLLEINSECINWYLVIYLCAWEFPVPQKIYLQYICGPGRCASERNVFHKFIPMAWQNIKNT